MGRNLYIADWHYDHERVIHYDNRPFLNSAEMNAELVRRWNGAVNEDDTVYILGDMFWCGAEAAVNVLKQLNGTKILIKGNHDKCSDADFRSQFALIADYLEIKDDGKSIVLCHYPITCFKNHLYNWVHLYGHVHNTFEYNMVEHDKFLMEQLYSKPCKMFNVGAMMPYIDYTPRTLKEILNS